MLIWRVITALILAPSLLAVIWLLPPLYTSLLFALVMTLAGWEWSRLADLRKLVYRVLFLITLWLSMAACIWLDGLGYGAAVILMGVTWWALACVWVVLFNSRGGMPRAPQTVSWLVGLLVLVPAWFAISKLAVLPFGAFWVTCLLMLMWSADSGAYFVGKAMGRHKLAPQVSPGKSVEGAVGGLVTGLLIMAGLLWWLGPDDIRWTGMMILASAVVVVSIFGDLFESVAKRQQGVKDSGGLLPGHGGVLDRIDSLTAASPVFFWLLAGSAL